MQDILTPSSDNTCCFTKPYGPLSAIFHLLPFPTPDWVAHHEDPVADRSAKNTEAGAAPGCLHEYRSRDKKLSHGLRTDLHRDDWHRRGGDSSIASWDCFEASVTCSLGGIWSCMHGDTGQGTAQWIEVRSRQYQYG